MNAEVNGKHCDSAHTLTIGPEANVKADTKGKTGWLRRGVVIPEDKPFWTYRVNIKLLPDFRALETGAAQLLGQWGKPLELTALLATGTGWEFDLTREYAAL